MRLDSLPGSILDGKYRIERQLGKGGMGAVFLAVHLGTIRTVAVKVIAPHLAGHDEFFLRFQREAEAAGRLRHPNVVNVTDFGITRSGGEELAYLVMEYLDGQTLSEYLAAHARPPVPVVLDIIDQVSLALDAAHQAGIVHRDLKPDNIWLESNLRGGFNVKVLDFGIAKLTDPIASTVLPAPVRNASVDPVTAAPGTDETLVMAEAPTIDRSYSGTAESPSRPLTGIPNTLQTIAGAILGTPAYMAPEQWRSDSVDYRADIYSLAAIAYQSLCGRPPFEGSTATELLQQHLKAEPESPRERNRSLSAALSRVILSGLRKDPGQRPPSAGTFAAQLRLAAEAEFEILRRGRDVARTHSHCFFALSACCFLPLIPVLLGLRIAARALFDAKITAAPVLEAALLAADFLLALAGFQMFKAASALAARNALSTGGFSPWPAMRELARRMPSFAGAQLVSLLDLRPRAFRENLLWPVVWALENRTMRENVDRSRRLCALLPAASTSLVARQYAPICIATLLFPAIMGIVGLPPSALGRLVLSHSGPGAFVLVYPVIISALLNLNYGPAFLFPLLVREEVPQRGHGTAAAAVEREKRTEDDGGRPARHHRLGRRSRRDAGRKRILSAPGAS